MADDGEDLGKLAAPEPTSSLKPLNWEGGSEDAFDAADRRRRKWAHNSSIFAVLLTLGSMGLLAGLYLNDGAPLNGSLNGSNTLSSNLDPKQLAPMLSKIKTEAGPGARLREVRIVNDGVHFVVTKGSKVIGFASQGSGTLRSEAVNIVGGGPIGGHLVGFGSAFSFSSFKPLVPRAIAQKFTRQVKQKFGAKDVTINLVSLERRKHGPYRKPTWTVSGEGGGRTALSLIAAADGTILENVDRRVWARR